MTTPPRTPDTPDDENGRADTPPAPSEGFAAPPPPDWGGSPQSAAAHLLPEPPAVAPEPDSQGGEQSAAHAETVEVRAEVEAQSAVQAGAGKTVTDLDISGTMQIQVFPQGQKSEAETEQQPAPAPTPPGTNDVPAPPPFPYGQDMSEQTILDAPNDQTRLDTPTLPPARTSAPTPFPYAQQIPRPQNPPAPEKPFPYAQEIPGTPNPPAPEPFPYAQDIPGTSPTPPAAAPEPFPYAQEVPGPRTPPANAPAPFPYAQEIPDARPPSPSSNASEPFPYAQAVPGTTQQQVHETVRPIAPPPPVDEPWRMTAKGKSKGGGRKRGKKPLLIGVASLSVAALAAGGFVVLSGGGDDGGDGGGAAKLAGAMFPMDGAAGTDGRDQEVSGVASVGSTVVAVGGESDAQTAHGLFLFSADGGRTFKSAKQEAADGGTPGPGEVPQVVGGGSSRGWVAIGTRPGGGAVWTSDNGQVWRRQPDAVGDVFGPNNRVRRIVATGSGFLAIGENSQKGDFSDATPAVWLSGDGRRWEARVGDQIGLQIVKGKFELVEAAASGNMILIEGIHTPDPKKASAYRRVFRSQDGGRTWSDSNVPVPKGSRGLIIGGGGAGFLAIRELQSGGKSYGQAFTSKDGDSWRAAGKLETPGYQRTSQLLGDGKGFAAVVVRGRDVLLSRSTDGATWKDAGSAVSQPGREIADAALAGDQTVLVGREPGGGDIDPMLKVWDAGGTAVPVDVAKIPGAIRPDHSVLSVGATGDLAVAVGSASGDAAVWTSKDGASWRSAQALGAAFTRPGPQQLLDVTGGKPGWLAVGRDQASPRRALVVTSADGTTWQAADNAAAFRPTKNGIPATNATASGPTGYVVVGTEGYSAAAWFSSDLKTWERGKSADQKALESQGGAGRWMLDVTGGTSGYVAVGGSRDAKGNHPAVWSSADGKQWSLQLLPLPGGVTEGHLTKVAARGNAIVAAGMAATAQGLVWLGYVSTDAGKTWRSLPAPTSGPNIVVTALEATPKGFVATGTTGRQGAMNVVSWTSPDGSSWKATTPEGKGLGGDGDQEITGLVSFKNSVLGVGQSTDLNDDQPVLWTRPVP